MREVENHYRQGLHDGIAIGLGYLSVSFTFGMLAVNNGMPIGVAVIISLSCLTSAGQFSGLTLIMEQCSFMELALSQLVINLRYALMSLSLTQKLDRKVRTWERTLVAYGITDEIYALASSTYVCVGSHYMLGLMTLPIICWTMGTLCGGIIGALLPQIIRNALGIAIYGMFLAIILPPARKLHGVRVVLIIASLMSCLFALCNALLPISDGFVVILCTLSAAAIGAWLFPICEEAVHE